MCEPFGQQGVDQVPAMPPSSRSDLAAQLDALDDKLHDLLIKKAALVEQAPLSGPAQQTITLRRLAARHEGGLPLASLVRIWREISASMPARATQVHVFAGEKVADYRDLARAYFGSLAQMESHPSASAVIHACASDAQAFGLVPPPDSDENARPWWAQLTPSGQTGPRVIARLPLIAQDNAQSGAYAIGTFEQEPTGSDTTLVILEVRSDLSRTKLQALMKDVGLEAQLVAVGRDSARSSSRLHLLEISGFIRSDDSRLGTLLEQAGETIVRLVCVGGYADPLVEPKAA
jgi:chorismate mutase/prephenate dehydratase